MLAALHHVVTVQRTDRHRHRIGNADARTEVNKLTFDGAESLLAPSNNVHLVDRRHHMANTQQTGNKRMPARLRGHAFTRVDQTDGQLAMTCTSCHVARVLLMTRAVGNDETTTRGSEVSPRNINSDSLFALSLQAVHCKRQIKSAASGSMHLAVFFKRSHVIFINATGVMEQAPNQRALAVIHAAAGKKPQQFIAFIAAQVVINALAFVHHWN